MPETLYEAVVEVDERVVLEQELCQLQLNTPTVTGNTGEKVGGRGEEGRGREEKLADKHYSQLVLYACKCTLHYTEQVSLACINSHTRRI